ncbi:sulfite exporter TauE/SafE family protein [Limnohabitans sp.]|uniref:sulfite exporter TauE/SafE family protein n=1 Tax=Limnohabitans sp. TaxID=1907725 RepID=UPI00286F485C|nr:sulfite exporter TauE/SafE family protein [Limnohabitans sp.]
MSFDFYFVLAELAALLVDLSKGGLPSVGMLAVPLLSLFMSPLKAAVLLLPIYVISDLMSVWLYRKNFSLPNLKILVPAGLLGVFIGWLTASFTSDSAVKLMIGCMGVGFCLNIWLRKTPKEKQAADTKKGWFWGTLSGFTSFISHAGGPPFQIYVLPQRLPNVQFEPAPVGRTS